MCELSAAGNDVSMGENPANPAPASLPFLTPKWNPFSQCDWTAAGHPPCGGVFASLLSIVEWPKAGQNWRVRSRAQGVPRVVYS